MHQDEKIVIRGAREHNLKNVSLELPRNKLIVMTGLSGSGKSSLAIDTIYAEGQRRYVESLSAYARQFLGQMDKPDVDHIDGLSPAICIDQKSTSKNPRSTVGTITEIYDYLRLLYARIGVPHCPKCGKAISQQTSQQITEQVLKLPEGAKFLVLAPVVRGRKGEFRELFERLRKDGFARVQVDGKTYGLEEEIRLDKKDRHTIDVVVDRLIMKEGVQRRLADSIETALKLGEGIVAVQAMDSNKEPRDGDERDSTRDEGNASNEDHDGHNEHESLFQGGRQDFSTHFACIDCGISFEELEPRMFSFNNPYGACPECSGLGTRMVVNPDLVIPDDRLSVEEGAIDPFSSTHMDFYPKMIKAVCEEFDIDMSTPWRDLDEDSKNILLYGTKGQTVRVKYRNIKGHSRVFQSAFEGAINNLARRHRQTDSDYSREMIERYMSMQPCPACNGARLKPESLAVTVGGLNIHLLCEKSTKKVLQFINGLELSQREEMIGSRILKEVRERIEFLIDVGLDYLTLNRSSGTLSGGEAQRIRLATQIGSGLVGVLYVLDEPSIGLHQRDNRRLIQTLKRLRDLGNTLIVVEHDEETMMEADHIVDIGPLAGEHGGHIVANGTVKEILKNTNSLTGQYLSGNKKIEVPHERRLPGDAWLKVKGASEHNLKNIDVEIPLGMLVCITGVSGSGKSTLVTDILSKVLMRKFYHSRDLPGKHSGVEGLENLDKAIEIDQSPIGRTPRSNPATYVKLFDEIRNLFSQVPESQVRGYKPGRFSFNVKGGRCEACNGDGTIKIEMHFLPDVYVPCEVCKGKRYNSETLEVTYKGKNISDILEMPVEEALAFFENHPKIRRKLQTLYDVGLGYVKLGQQAPTLSGGEAQRVKLAAELGKIATGRTFYILDEPTTGLHFADIEKLLSVLGRLVDNGNTVLVIEHNLDVVKTADWVIDLGPEGGDGGGRVIAAGSPETIVDTSGSYTGMFLREVLNKTKDLALKS
jgi:excinuclease ABC subunit A